MADYVKMRKQLEGADGPTEVRVVRSAFERVWKKRGWELVSDSDLTHDDGRDEDGKIVDPAKAKAADEQALLAAQAGARSGADRSGGEAGTASGGPGSPNPTQGGKPSQ